MHRKITFTYKHETVTMPISHLTLAVMKSDADETG